MYQVVILWTVIVFLLILAIILNTISVIKKQKNHHYLGYCNEKEIFYCPGDSNNSNKFLEDKTVSDKNELLLP